MFLNISQETVPGTPGDIEGSCPDGSWQEYGGFCYQIFETLGDPER